MRALNDMLDRIAQTTHSLAYFRFCCADLLSVIVRQAEALQLPVSAKDVLRASVLRNLLAQVFRNLEEDTRT